MRWRQKVGVWVARSLLVLSLVIVLIAILLPNSRLAALRIAYPWLSGAISRTERLCPDIDMVHVAMFSVLGFLAALSYPRVWHGRIILVIFVLAAATEFFQIWIPGRTSSLVEVLLDVAAASLGMLPILLVRALLRSRQPTQVV